MIQSPQVAPISSLRRDHVAVLKKLQKGPVFIAQRGTLTAALVSIQQWDETAQLIKTLQAQLSAERRLRLSNQRYAEALNDPSQLVSQEEYAALLAKAGLAE